MSQGTVAAHEAAVAPSQATVVTPRDSVTTPQGIAGEVDADTLRVGTVLLHRCDTGAPWCGYLERPMAPGAFAPPPTGTSGAPATSTAGPPPTETSGPPPTATAGVPSTATAGAPPTATATATAGTFAGAAGSISIYFEYYPHTGEGKATGTLVATEGGPGYPATESRDEFLEFFRPLRATRDVVLMDNRGTGRSGAVDCRPLQTDPVLSEANIGRCGRTLGAKANLYSSVFAADDLAAILDALGSGPIDLYGDSYGTFFEQVFAVRHPDKLRSMILDGAYPLDGAEYAWYPNYAPAMRAKFDLACERSNGCSRLLGTSLEHITPALEALRRAPTPAKANATLLAMVMFGSAPAFATVRETDAAARAYVAGDTAPLLRLMAETRVSVDSRDETKAVSMFSAGLAAAVMCTDAPQIFDMSLDPVHRAAARDEAIAERKRSSPDGYAPFTIDEYRAMPLDYAFLDQCASWPAFNPAPMAKLRNSPYPDVPALVISGDLDNMTPVADGTLVAKRFPHGRQLLVPNGFHVNALPHSRSACPADIARHFIETLEVGDTKCLASIPEVRVLPAFALRVFDLEPAQALEGNQASRGQLQIVTGALLTVGDAIARMGSNSTGKAVGLRGGAFEIVSAANGHLLTLHDVRWANDLRVSGTLMYPGRSGDAVADLTVVGPEGVSGALKVRWTEGVAKARAQVRGSFGKVAVAAEASAP